MKRGKILIFILIVLLLAMDYVFLNYADFNLLGNVINFGNDKGKTEEKIVTKIIDGDTVVVSGGESVRLLGIDCDERGRECYTPAKNRIDELLLGKTVILESGKEDKDQYKRLLRYIFLNGKNINLQMVEEGFCIARFEGDENAKYRKEIREAEKFAIENKIGCKWN
ncbi:thermonuclease family protein [Candidatus Pacearchaeota archaeon]|nr:thermonuclease family protein [Candidatus Pacearchaeota archaeon]